MTPGGLVGYNGATNTFAISATTGDVSMRGQLNGGDYTGYNWPASGTGFHLSSAGLLMGRYDVSNPASTYFQFDTATGALYANKFSIVGGNATFSGTLSAGIVNTDQIVGGAVSVPVIATGTGASVSVTVSVPTGGAAAILIDYYLGPPTSTAYGGGSKDGGGSGFVYGPVLSGLTYDGSTAGAVIVAPAAGNHTITVTRSYYTGTARLSVVVLKR
jgi:hypothetical protein